MTTVSSGSGTNVAIPDLVTDWVFVGVGATFSVVGFTSIMVKLGEAIPAGTDTTHQLSCKIRMPFMLNNL